MHMIPLPLSSSNFKTNTKSAQGFNVAGQRPGPAEPGAQFGLVHTTANANSERQVVAAEGAGAGVAIIAGLVVGDRNPTTKKRRQPVMGILVVCSDDN